MAATLELRGYGLGVRHRMPRHRRSPGELAMVACGVLMLALLLAASLAGAAAFDAYPRISVDVDAATLGLAAALALLPLVPFARPRARRLGPRELPA
jgi:hypothetical protein